MAENVYQIVTDRIVGMLEKGTVPWRRPWSERAGGLGEHQNLVSQHAYRGINALITASQGYEKPFWLTYKQASDLGAQVRKGERGTPVVYIRAGVEEKPDGSERKYCMYKYSTVFNIAQVEGERLHGIIDRRMGKQAEPEFTPIESCERIAGNFKHGPTVGHAEQRAYYKPSADHVNMPRRESFNRPEAYYATLFHELTHSTGHESRLKREGIQKVNLFGSHDYSKEELVAEMGSAFLCAKAGIDTITLDQSAAYIANWLKVLKNDPKMVVQAASQAQRASDLIQGITPDLS